LPILLLPGGHVIVSGSASISGSGSLSANSLVIESVASSLSGSGSVTADSLVVTLASASISGSGSVSASGKSIIPDAVVLTDGGSLTATAIVIVISSAALSGSGDATNLFETFYGDATLSGIGSIIATGKIKKPTKNAIIRYFIDQPEDINIITGKSNLKSFCRIYASPIVKSHGFCLVNAFTGEKFRSRVVNISLFNGSVLSPRFSAFGVIKKLSTASITNKKEIYDRENAILNSEIETLKRKLRQAREDSLLLGV